MHLLENENYPDKFTNFVDNVFVAAGYTLTRDIALDAVPESAKYHALVFSINDQAIVYRKAKVTVDRPGAFLAIWQRPSAPNITSNKPIPLKVQDLDYLFVQVQDHSPVNPSEKSALQPQRGLFIFPVSLLVKKGIISADASKGKTGFRVFPPWSEDRGVVGTKIFSASGKKTQQWQLPYFVEIDDQGLMDVCVLTKIFDHK